MPWWSGGTLMGVVATLFGSRRACVHEGVACLSCLPAWPVCTSVGCCSCRFACLPRPMIESERNIGCLFAPIVDPLRLRSTIPYRNFMRARGPHAAGTSSNIFRRKKCDFFHRFFRDRAVHHKDSQSVIFAQPFLASNKRYSEEPPKIL